jgi:hypothetical protein
MSGSSGNTSAGSQGGRAPRNGNSDITSRRGPDAPSAKDDTGAESSARGTRTGRADSERSDPDAEEDAEEA